jgi:hypothetical protein
MRRVIYAAAGAAALALAGLAVADNVGPKAIKAVNATFIATGVTNSRTQTCTNADGTFAVTSASYTGMATSSDASLNGPVTLKARSVINTTKSLGTVDGALRIVSASGAKTDAHFTAVYQNGQLAGFAIGHAADPYSRLLANVSASFSAVGGFTNGKLGSTSGGGAVELQPGRCEPTKPPKPIAERSEARGTISAVSATSITVAQLTCTVPANTTLAAKVAKLTMGTRASIECRLVNGVNTLTAIKVQEGS